MKPIQILKKLVESVRKDYSKSIEEELSFVFDWYECPEVEATKKEKRMIKKGKRQFEKGNYKSWDEIKEMLESE